MSYDSIAVKKATKKALLKDKFEVENFLGRRITWDEYLTYLLLDDDEVVEE